MLALLPKLISKPHLAEANAWMQGSEQITNVVGPAAAGIAIGAFGLPLAFAVDTALFALGSGCIFLVRTRQRSLQIKSNSISVSLTKEISEGLRYAWQQPAIRISLLTIAMINFALLDPFSQAISGVLLEINLTGLFVAAESMMLITAFVVSLPDSDRSTSS